MRNQAIATAVGHGFCRVHAVHVPSRARNIIPLESRNEHKRRLASKSGALFPARTELRRRSRAFFDRVYTSLDEMGPIDRFHSPDDWRQSFSTPELRTHPWLEGQELVVNRDHGPCV
jgi:hypothetical protein